MLRRMEIDAERIAAAPAARDEGAAPPGPASEPPRSLVQELRRTFLAERIGAEIERRLVLVRAPAGFGKTELVAALWRALRRRGQRVVWVSLRPGWGRAEVMAAVAAGLGVAPGAVAETLAAARAEAPIHLIFDEAEALGAAAEPIAWAVEALSEGTRIVVCGRRFPPLRLSRLRMRGLLAEFDHTDLAFGRGETQQLLGQLLRPEEVDRLAETLAGWPALAQLAAVALDRARGAADRAALLEGTHPIPRDFVLEEVIPSLGPVELSVLRACRDLHDFTLEIAVDLAGLPHDSETLRLLEGLPPLILAHEQRSGWFRPHPVVAAALAADSDEDAAARARRHRRASELFAERGYLEKAVLHASMAGDYDLAVRTIEAAGGANLFLRAGYTVLRGIIRAVPHEVVLGAPSLRLCRCVMLAKSGLVAEARGVVAGVVEEVEAGVIPPDPRLAAMLEHLSSLIDVYEDRGIDAPGIAALETKVREARREETWRLGWVHNNLAIAYTRSDDLEAAQTHAERALACYQEERSSYPQVFMRVHLAHIAFRGNRIDAAREQGRLAEELIRGRQWNDLNLLSIARVPIAAVQYARGDVSGARQALERGMPILARGEGWVDFFALGYATLARARFALDGWQAAREALADGFAVADARGLGRLALVLSIVELELLTRSGQIDAARSVARRLPDPEEAAAWPTRRERAEARLALARLALRAGEADAADRRLAELALAVEGIAGERGLLLRVNLLRVEAAWGRGDTETALAALGAAAELALSGAQVRQVHDEGRGLAEAIRALVRRTGVSRLTPVTADFVARIARAPGMVATHGILSAREAEILGLLEEGLSNKAIARRLDLTEPTVKFHLKNLYAKLGVGRRALALSVARASGLLAAEK
ncbi:MAG: hypothetical protein DI556_12305 [Rhodovulum sulfidophilum]|uniref:HTH luxR-type domain-containing protein n=1 Tax=Rhodovulum sulfidophilum TaxID=35806 RepID=A0A2W5N625_RHOSU|nr:MAG: hypothetical protein DI556_12305 [Rhodovulum sulfidophilum]